MPFLRNMHSDARTARKDALFAGTCIRMSFGGENRAPAAENGTFRSR